MTVHFFDATAYHPPRFWLWDGETLRAAQSTLADAKWYQKPGWHITTEPKSDGKRAE